MSLLSALASVVLPGMASDLRSRSFLHRNRALGGVRDDMKKKLDKRLHELERQADEARADHDKAIASAEREHAEARVELDAELAGAAAEELRAAGRDAGKMASAWRKLNGRCIEELGCPLDGRHLDLAIAHTHDLADRVGEGFDGVFVAGDGPMSFARPPHPRNAFLTLAADERTPRLLLEDAFAALERHVVGDLRDDAGDPELAAALLAHADANLTGAALAELRKRRADARQEKFKADEIKRKLLPWSDDMVPYVGPGKPSRRYVDQMQREHESQRAALIASGAANNVDLGDSA